MKVILQITKTQALPNNFEVEEQNSGTFMPLQNNILKFKFFQGSVDPRWALPTITDMVN